ncbi:CAP-Gly domain-containing linker protein 1 [Trichinella patagoniensis]|uniref:CAP-Gly domain-containing linker protein 1 n=1 Tax=Trichinella patagoniensis TaxID=990121 RepID=A0A0V0ZAH7_9BILA|nr:CAP-Gly domain-containing linker protein 1 [Trichinella patagoniensis]
MNLKKVVVLRKHDGKGGGFQSHLRRPSQFRRNKPADIIPTAVASKLPTLDGISVPRAAPNQSTLIPVEQLLSSTFEKHIGNRVRVAGEKAGSLRYIGTVQGREGFYCGIELDEPIGSHDGALNGIRYFQTNPNRAIFAPLDRVEVIVDHKQSFKPVDCWMNDVEPLLISSCCSEDRNSDLMVQSDISLAGSPPANSSLLSADLTTPYQATSEADLFSAVDVQKSPSTSVDNNSSSSKEWSKETAAVVSVCPAVDDLNVTITVDVADQQLNQHTVCLQSAENSKPPSYCNSDDIQSELIKSDDDDRQQLSTFDNKMVNIMTSCDNTTSSQSTSSATTTLSTDEAVVRKELLVPSENKKIKYEPNKMTIKSSDSAKRISMAKVTPNRTQVRTIQRVPSKPSKHAEIMAKLKESIKQDKEKGKKEIKSRIAQSIQLKPTAKITAASQNNRAEQFPSSKQSSQESSSSNEACHSENPTKGVTVRNRSANDISKHIISTKRSDMVPKLRAQSRFDDAFVEATSFYHYNPNSAVSCFHCGALSAGAACVNILVTIIIIMSSSLSSSSASLSSSSPSSSKYNSLILTRTRSSVGKSVQTVTKLPTFTSSVVLRDSAYSSNMTNDRIGYTPTRSSSYTLHPVSSRFVQSFQPAVNSKKEPASAAVVKRPGNGPLATGNKRGVAKALPVLEKRNSTSIKRMVDEHKYQEIVKGFLALSVTFNHYQDHLIPVLHQRNANVKNELEKLKAAFESTVCEYEKIKEEREELCKQHAKTIDELNEKHEEAIRCLEIALKQEHDQHLKQICEDNEKILDKLRSTFDEKIKSKDVKMKSEKCQIEVCQLDHQSPVQGVDRKEQVVIADVRYVNHEKEIDSLRAVLEMKSEENRELRSRLAEREKEIEEAMKMKSRVILLDQKNAELKEALELKKTTEKRLSQRHHDLVRSCEREKENSRRLQMDKEQLQFQLERVLMSQSAYDTPISRLCSSSESTTPNVQDELQQNSMSQSLIQIYADCSPRYSKELPVTFYSNEGVEKKILENDQKRCSSMRTSSNRGEKIGRKLTTTSSRSRHFSNSSDASDADEAYKHRRRVQSDCEMVEKENQRVLPNCTGRGDLPASESSNADSMLMTVDCTDSPRRCSHAEKRCQLAGSTDYCKGDNCMQKAAASCIDSGIFTASYHSDIFDTPLAVSGTEQTSKHVGGQVGGDFAEQS